jgi:hypothetical protein
MGLEERDRDLALLAIRSQSDPMLALLAETILDAEGGTGLGITVLVGGVMISGEITSPTRFAADFDQKLLEGMKESSDPSERMVEVIEMIETEGWIRGLTDRARAAREQVQAELDGLGDEEPDEDLARADLVGTEPVTLNLASATIFPPNAAPLSADMVRVRLANIDAWWLGVVQ